MLIIQPSLPTYREAFFCELAETLKKEITILHFSKKSNIKHPLIKEIIGNFINLNGIKYIKNINKFIKKESTIITVFDPHWINLFTLPLFSRKKNIILWGHGAGKSTLVNHLRIPFINKANCIITYSEERKKKLLNLNIKDKKIYVANNTLDVPNSQDTSQKSKKNFLYVGRLQRRKKLDVFFNIFKELALDRKGYDITIIGDGDEEKKFLENHILKLGIKKSVEFKPGTSSEKILLENFSSATYYVSPGAVGLGVLHSFAYGVPVLTMKDPAHGPEVSNIQEGINGYIFSDQIDFKNKLINILDSNTATTMGKNSFIYYQENRTIQKMVEEFIQAIHSNSLKNEQKNSN